MVRLFHPGLMCMIVFRCSIPIVYVARGMIILAYTSQIIFYWSKYHLFSIFIYLSTTDQATIQFCHLCKKPPNIWNRQDKVYMKRLHIIRKHHYYMLARNISRGNTEYKLSMLISYSRFNVLSNFEEKFVVREKLLGRFVLAICIIRNHNFLQEYVWLKWSLSFASSLRKSFKHYHIFIDY